MLADDFLKSEALLIAWHYGQEHGTNGILAVLFCLRNRVDGGEGGWQEVVLEEGLPEIPHPTGRMPDVRDPVFQKALHLVDVIFDGTAEDRLTNGATHFYYFYDTQRVAVVGNLILYK